MTIAALPADLAAAIERAYEVFAGYRFANTVGCGAVTTTMSAHCLTGG